MDDPPVGLRKNPFGATADPDVFYPSPTHQSACAELFSAVKTLVGLIVLTGESGTGKTTVLRRVTRDVEGSGARVLWWNVGVSLEEMVASLLQQLGAADAAAPDAPRAALLAALQTHARRGGATLVAVDEAQNLGPAELGALRGLAEAETGSGVPLAVLLVGHPELDASLAGLAGEGAGPVYVLRVALSRLESSEVAPYVAYRLAQAGAREVFQPDAVARVAAYTEGIPRVINNLCDAALRAASQAGVATVAAPTVDAAARLLGLPVPDHVILEDAPPAGVRGRAAPRATIRAWPLGAGAAALVLLAAVLFALRPTSQLLPPPSPVAGPAEAPAPPPVAREPRTRLAETTPATQPAPPAAPHRVERPADTGRKLAREPSVRPGAGLGPPSRAASPTPAPSVERPPSTAGHELVDAAEAGNVTAVAALLAAGAPPDARDVTEMTPLMVAVVHDHGAVVELLLSRGANVNAGDDGGVTALMLAANNGRVALLQRLLDHGANVNARTRAGWTALMYAAWNGRTEGARRLLAAGANPVLTDRIGWTALRYASWRAADVAKAPNGADPLAIEDPEPIEAASRRYAELVTLLSGAGTPKSVSRPGADVSARGSRGL